MSAEAKKFGPLPEGGEMLVLALVMFGGVIGLIFLMLTLSPGFNWSDYLSSMFG